MSAEPQPQPDTESAWAAVIQSLCAAHERVFSVHDNALLCLRAFAPAAHDPLRLSRGRLIVEPFGRRRGREIGVAVVYSMFWHHAPYAPLVPHINMFASLTQKLRDGDEQERLRIESAFKWSTPLACYTSSREILRDVLGTITPERAEILGRYAS